MIKEEEERICLVGHWGFYFCVAPDSMKAAFKYYDMSCVKLLIYQRFADYGRLFEKAIDDGSRTGDFKYD